MCVENKAYDGEVKSNYQKLWLNVTLNKGSTNQDRNTRQWLTNQQTLMVTYDTTRSEYD